jgi:hypothetical protein
VTDVRPFDEGVKAFPFPWSDGLGGFGFLVPSVLERARDLAQMEPLRADDVFPHPFTVSQSAPKPGDRIWFLGYSWKNKKSAMEPDVIEARITRIVALHLLFTPSGKPGSSGSCVVNEAGEVVAINEGGYSVDDGGEVGLAVGVWNGLWRMPE